MMCTKSCLDMGPADAVVGDHQEKTALGPQRVHNRQATQLHRVPSRPESVSSKDAHLWALASHLQDLRCAFFAPEKPTFTGASASRVRSSRFSPWRGLLQEITLPTRLSFAARIYAVRSQLWRRTSCCPTPGIPPEYWNARTGPPHTPLPFRLPSASRSTPFSVAQCRRNDAYTPSLPTARKTSSICQSRLRPHDSACDIACPGHGSDIDAPSADRLVLHLPRSTFRPFNFQHIFSLHVAGPASFPLRAEGKFNRDRTFKRDRPPAPVLHPRISIGTLAALPCRTRSTTSATRSPRHPRERQ